MIARNVRPIIDARLKGYRPNELVIVSLIGLVRERNHTCYANPAVSYDWRWARGLQVCIYTSTGIAWGAVASAIASVWPQFLGVWNVDTLSGETISLRPHLDDIELARHRWRWVLDRLPWHRLQNEEFAWN